MVAYNLTYFNSRGNGEIARQVFAYSGQPFEDERITKEEWALRKNDTPFGQVPVLYVDGKQLAQSIAIVRFLSKQFGIAGNSSWEEAQIDALADQFKDYRLEVRPFFRAKMGFGGAKTEDEIGNLYQNVFLPVFNRTYELFTSYLAKSGSGYLVGDSLTWVDLSVAQHSADLLAVDKNILENFPKMKEHQERVHGLDNLKKWIETRPKTER